MGTIQISWDDQLQVGEDEAIRKCLSTLLPTGILPSHPHLIFRVAELAFYPKLIFIEVTDLGQDGKARMPTWLLPPSPTDELSDQALSRQLYVLIDPEMDEVEVMDMTNAPIYLLNSRGYLDLGSGADALERVKQYVAFFFSCVAGPYGVMPVVEKLALPDDDEDDFTPEIASSLKDLRERYVAPGGPTAQQDPSREGQYKVFVALLFQGAVFKSTVEVDPTGMVRVTEHELALASGDDASDEPAGDEPAGEKP